MDYQRIYDEIIQNAKLSEEERKFLKEKNLEYFENHHIIPRSSGGSNEKDNLVLLKAREHFLCHWLLYKINPTQENAFSWWMMSNSDGNFYHKERVIQTSKKYEYARKAFSEHIGKLHKGKPLSDEHKQKLSLSKIKDKNHFFGKKHSEEHKQYLSKINLGENNAFFGKKHSIESKIKMSESAKKRIGVKSNRYGKKHSEETKIILSEINAGKPRSVPHEIVECPYCKKLGIKPNMKRWHFDNCKEKANE